MTDFRASDIILVAILVSFMLIYFVTAIVFFFLEGRESTRRISAKTWGISGFILILGVLTASLTRYFIDFPEVGGYDLNSDLNYYFSLASAVASFLIYILYIRTGEHFAREKGIAGSLYLKGKLSFRSINWKVVILPVPFLILWTMVLFSVLQPEASDLVEAMTPKDDNLITWVYMLLSVSISAPLTEELLFRHYAMGFLYKLLGTRKTAIFFNILITSVVFAIAHLSILNDDWIKIVQIIPLGMALGYINYKKGVEHSILVHSLFNTLSIPVSYIVDYIARLVS